MTASTASNAADQDPVEVIGPFSVWPRPEKRRTRPLVYVSLAGISAAITAHCVLPLVI